MQVAIIADDLTGAADSGVQLARAGYRTAVAFRGSPMPPPDVVDAIATDTDSRALPPGVAAERVAEAARALRGAEVVYKKLDSTLRGPVAAELSAALEATGREVTVVCPAFPDTGRTVREGVLLVGGIPVNETSLNNDPVTPVREGHLPTLLSETFPSVAVLSTDDLRDAPKVREVLAGASCVVADASTDVELEALVRAVPYPGSVLWAGSAGLARAFGAVYPGSRPRGLAAIGGPPPLAAAAGVVVVVGSVHEVARGQLEVLLEEPDVEPVPLNVADLLEEAGNGAVARGAVEALRAVLESGRAAALYSAGDVEAGSGGEAAGRVADALAEVVAGLPEGLLGGLVLTGGDVAARVAGALGATGILLAGELEPGVPVGSLIGPRPHRVITKSGGFGGSRTLLDAHRHLTRARRKD